MGHLIGRRDMVRALGCAALVYGFDPLTRGWVTRAHAHHGVVPVPPLDGELTSDPAVVQAAADDFGHIVHRVPIAVLRPGSYQDIAKMVLYARRSRLKIAMRGAGHSNFGQPQVDAGIVIDSSTLATIHEILPDRITVDAGVFWRAIVDAVVPLGKSPPVLTDYLDLSVGGTLSVGGIGGASLHYGLQVDNVLELTVVTGRGDIVDCSPWVNRSLFEAVLAGGGQCGIIVRATIPLVEVASEGIVFNLFYDDLRTFMRDEEFLLRDGRFEYLEGQIAPKPDGSGYRFQVEAVKFFDAESPPDVSALLSGLHDDRPSAQTLPTTYLAWQRRLDPLVDFLKATGAWALPHPWYEVYTPASTTAALMQSIVSSLTAADTGGGPVLFYPVLTKRVTRPFFRLPREPIAWGFHLLRFAPDSATAEAMLDDNRSLYEDARRVGGSRYIVGAIPFDHFDWVRHFGPVWPRLVGAKHRFDPHHVLTPGQGIFGHP